MFGLDFQKLHNHLFPRRYSEVTGMPVNGQGAPDYPVVNPESPRSGVHLCRETIFTSGSLAFICYAKNMFSNGGETPTGVKVCLKITAGIKKGRGSYGSTRVFGETISFECALQDLVGIWRVLRGRVPRYSLWLPLPGATPKALDVKCQPEASDPYYLAVSEGDLSISVPFNEGAAVTFQAVMLAVVRVLYPHLEMHAAISLLDGALSFPAKGEVRSMASNVDLGTDEFEPDLRDEGDEDVPPGLRKTIYAVCLNRWPAKRKDVAQYIQRNATKRPAQRIVDSANSGDFTELDKIAGYLDGRSK